MSWSRTWWRTLPRLLSGSSSAHPARKQADLKWCLWRKSAQSVAMRRNKESQVFLKLFYLSRIGILETRNTRMLWLNWFLYPPKSWVESGVDFWTTLNHYIAVGLKQLEWDFEMSWNGYWWEIYEWNFESTLIWLMDFQMTTGFELFSIFGLNEFLV